VNQVTSKAEDVKLASRAENGTASKTGGMVTLIDLNTGYFKINCRFVKNE